MSQSANKASPQSTVVLAYSGGLDTSCILVWLKQQGYSVIAYLANLGQDEDFAEAETKARKLGAKEVVIDDLRQELIEDFVWVSIQGDCCYEGQYLLGTALARPCIVKGIVRTARKYGANFISHGATGKGNDQVRFEFGCATLLPAVEVIAPWRDPSFYERFRGRQDLFDFAAVNGISLPVTPKSPWSIDGNIIHVSYESGCLENPSIAAPEGICQMTVDPEKAPDSPLLVTITFKAGVPDRVSIGDSKQEITGSLEVFTAINNAACRHGVGRIDIVENRFLGLKSRGVYETPALTVLRTAHQDLESVCQDREVTKVKRRLGETLAQQIYNGLWFSPECDYVRKCVRESQSHVNGNVTLKLFKGSVRVVSRRGADGSSLYNADLVSMDHHQGYNPVDATGFIKIHALRLKEYAKHRGEAQ